MVCVGGAGRGVEGFWPGAMGVVPGDALVWEEG